MNGKGLIVAVLGVGVALGGLMLQGHASINADIGDVRADIGEIRTDIAELRERMARLEGLFEGHLNRDSE